jgi:hypothetical protein
VPGFREVLLDCIRDLRNVIRDKRLRPQDCKGYLPHVDEPAAALVYFRIGATVFAAWTLPGPQPRGEASDRADMPWNLAIAVAVDDEAID